MPAVTIPILPLFLILPGVAVTLGVGIALTIFAAQGYAPRPGGIGKVAVVILIASTVSLVVLGGVLVTYLPWSTP